MLFTKIAFEVCKLKIMLPRKAKLLIPFRFGPLHERSGVSVKFRFRFKKVRRAIEK